VEAVEAGQVLFTASILLLLCSFSSYSYFICIIRNAMLIRLFLAFNRLQCRRKHLNVNVYNCWKTEYTNDAQILYFFNPNLSHFGIFFSVELDDGAL